MDFQKLIYPKLYKHIYTNNILIKEQHGFWINSSTKAASYNIINEILKATNNRLSVGGILCDREKAFDYVNHGILRDTLVFYGISGKFLTLIQSYLTERYKKNSLITLTHIVGLLLDGRLQTGFLRVRSWACYFFSFILMICPQ